MEKNKQIDQKKQPLLSDEELWFSASAADRGQTYNVEAAFSRFLKRSALENAKPVYRLRFIYYAAAAVALLLIVSTFSYHQGSRQVEKQFSDIVVEAPLGAKTKMMLPDGTTVWLNAGSRMVYSQGFGMTDRNLTFEGEGYFEVEKNEELPFAVSTQDLNVKVLGTKFNFRNYPEDEEATVNLLEGKVALENRIKTMDTRYLAPSEKMILNKKTGEIQIIPGEVEQSKAWTNDVLVFDEMLLPDIVRELERSYNVDIEISNTQLVTARFYGYFNRKQQSVYDILDRLVQTGRLQYGMKNEKIELK